MERIRLARGTLVAGVGDRVGKRAAQQHASGINKRGGKKVRQPEKDKVHWIHPDARVAYRVKLETSSKIHASDKKLDSVVVRDDDKIHKTSFVDDDEEDSL